MPTRKQIRIPQYNYAANGAYFVTICARKKAKIFGEIVNAGYPTGPYTQLSELGEIVARHIQYIPCVYSNVFVDKYVIMPNHIHLLIRIDTQEGPDGCPAPTDTKSIPKILAALKSLCTKEYGSPIWQRGYYEHVIRNEDDYLECARYIENNPAAWAEKNSENRERTV